MPKRVPVQGILVRRDGKLVRPKLGVPFDFTAEELEDIKNANPDAVTKIASTELMDEDPAIAKARAQQEQRDAEEAARAQQVAEEERAARLKKAEEESAAEEKAQAEADAAKKKAAAPAPASGKGKGAASADSL